jgi:hypothetical protein
MVAPFSANFIKIHHLDFPSYNNDPDRSFSFGFLFMDPAF